MTPSYFVVKYRVFLLCLLAIQISRLAVYAESDLGDIDLDTPGSENNEDAPSKLSSEDPDAKSQKYISPQLNRDNFYLYENFDDEHQFKTKWIQSSEPRYEGKWQLKSAKDRPDVDRQLLLPQKARHYAIGAKLDEQFKFSNKKPLVLQYEVQFRDGLDCGGAYVKMLRNLDDLTKMSDKTPYTIMFGPDKCGSESKLHFIVQYLNPKTQKFEEKHWKQSKLISNLMPTFNDKKHHLYRLLLEPNNHFEIFLDDVSVGKGNLLEDMEPAINPPKEIVDPNDSKPADWDDRPTIDDPEAKKPDDWDEDAPKMIEDPSASKPTDWLEDEPKYIPDPVAKKPDDWEEMDGEWEAPLIENPACVGASGCGEWKRPMIANPEYKGKWKPGKIDNPGYQGKWTPGMIPNPDYFHDEDPFSSLKPIDAVAFELWSMADNIAFDNLIVTSDVETASLLKFLTWQEKKTESDSKSESFITRGLHYLQINPWLWIVVAASVALPLFLVIYYCCETKKSSKSSSAPETGVARRKKVDESRPDQLEGEKDEEAEEMESENDAASDQEDEEVEQADEAAGDKTLKRQVRQRKKN